MRAACTQLPKQFNQKDYGENNVDFRYRKRTPRRPARRNAGLASHAMELINNPETGGLSGLVQQFHDKGLGEIVNSWVGPGGNHRSPQSRFRAC